MFSNALLSLISVCKCLGRQWLSNAFCFQFVNVHLNEKLSCLLEAEGIPTLTQKRSHPELSSNHPVLIKLKVMLHWYEAFEYVYFIIRFRAVRGHHTVTLLGYKNNYSPFGYDGMQSSFHMFYLICDCGWFSVCVHDCVPCWMSDKTYFSILSSIDYLYCFFVFICCSCCLLVVGHVSALISWSKQIWFCLTGVHVQKRQERKLIMIGRFTL